MLALQSPFVLQPGNWLYIYFPFALLAFVISLAILVLLRQGRNEALEQMLTHSDFGAPTVFQGTLIVEEFQPGNFLRLSNNTKEARQMQFLYRWVIGTGKQAIFDEVAFDGARRVVDLRTKAKRSAVGFSNFSAIRMREVASGRGGNSLWHLELINQSGKATPLLTSALGNRKAKFEQTAALAKAVSIIMNFPIQVYVAGTTWTPGWPPKHPATQSNPD